MPAEAGQAARDTEKRVLEEILSHQWVPDVHLQIPQKRLGGLGSHLGERRWLVL